MSSLTSSLILSYTYTYVPAATLLMPLKLVFEQTDPCNAVLVRSDDGKLAYRSSAPSITLGKRVTKITRIDRTGLEHLVASIKWEEPVKDDSEIALYM